MRLYAPAKINWALEVLGPSQRHPGYHEVRTVMQTIDLCDVIDLAPAQELSVAVEGRAGTPEDELVLAAARLLREHGGRRLGAFIRLTKRIPVAAGLGGGSSDAAAVLRGLNALWELGYDLGRLVEIAAAVGSDAPFFLYGGSALAAGRGERISPLPDAPPAWLVLVLPPFDLPDKTKRMYAALSPDDFSHGSRSEAAAERVRRGEPLGDGDLYNAFERVAYERFPGLAAYRDALLAAGARRAHLAGSGPALFALTADETEARRIHHALRLPDGQSFAVPTIGAARALRAEP